MRLAASTRMPSREMSAFSSLDGSALRISTSERVTCGELTTGAPRAEQGVLLQVEQNGHEKPPGLASNGSKVAGVSDAKGAANVKGVKGAAQASVGDVTLFWPGRAWNVDATKPNAGRCPRVTVDETVAARSGDSGRLIYGDALDVGRLLLEEGQGGKVDLVYVDPPFASQASYVHEARLDGAADGRVVRTLAYSDRWSAGSRSSTPFFAGRERETGEGIGAYLDMLAPRLEMAARLLAPTGTLWVHLDWRAAYLVRVLLDEILGRDAFLNEIVWRRAPNLGRQAASAQFGRTLDTLVVYGGSWAELTPPTRLEPIEKGAFRFDDEGRPFTTAPRGDYTDASIEKLDAQGRVYRSPTGKVYIKYFLVKDDKGKWCRKRRVDTLWTDVAPLRHASRGERTGFPTQKPRALLERIVRCASPPGGLVVDLFAGSGTTGAAAHASGRRFILGDAGHVAIATARARLLREGAGLSLERLDDAALPQGAPPSVRARRSESGGVDVELLLPEEPLAWAVDASYDGVAFRADWHSERRPGTKTVRADAVAHVDSPSDRIAVRVYVDDGTVSTLEVPLPASLPGHRREGA
jgi:DNA modification methylase